MLRSGSAADRIKTVVAKQYGARLFGRYYYYNILRYSRLPRNAFEFSNYFQIFCLLLNFKKVFHFIYKYNIIKIIPSITKEHNIMLEIAPGQRIPFFLWAVISSSTKTDQCFYEFNFSKLFLEASESIWLVFLI